MVDNVRNRARYRLAKKRIKREFEKGNAESMYSATGKKARLIIYLKVGKPLVFRGKISLPLHKFVFKKEYPDKKKENPGK